MFLINEGFFCEYEGIYRVGIYIGVSIDDKYGKGLFFLLIMVFKFR